MMNTPLSDSIIVRLATMADSENILTWRNDPETRKQSHHSDIISEDRHVQWFIEKLNDPNFCIYIAENTKQQTSIGVVTFQYRSDASDALVSLNICPNHRGQGFGQIILQKAVASYTAKNTTVLVAEIKAGNPKSQQVFSKCGFAFYHQDEQTRVYKNKLVIIDAIERIRSKNNVNWMNLMRLAFKTAPHEAEEIFSKINADDTTIANLLKQLTLK